MKKVINISKVILVMLFACILLIPEITQAAEGFDKVAKGSDLASQKEVKSYGMIPIYGEYVKDGSYEIKVKSSSSFFHIEKAVLNVKDGKMDTTITMSSSSYNYIYLGKAEDAAKAEMSDYIKYKEQADYYTFSFPVKALNEEIQCAAFSKRKKKWYDRNLLFDASSLEKGVLAFNLPDYDKIDKAMELYEAQKEAEKAEKDENTEISIAERQSAWTPTEAMDWDLKDGEYSIELDMTGGSGRASISSPTLFVIKDGKAYAQLIWSSTYYDYMIVGGQKYENLNQDNGSSTFLIPISAMDVSIPVIGDTTAMGDPVEIEYELTFYSDSIGAKSMIPQEAAKRVLVIGLVMILIGGIINQIFKKRRFS